MKLSRVRHIIKEEIQKLHEVKPFVDPKLKTKPTDPVQYIATNDHRYPSELAFLDIKKNEIVFFNIQRKEVERVSMERLNSTHWVRDYLPGGTKADIDMDRVFQKGRTGSRLTDESKLNEEPEAEYLKKMNDPFLVQARIMRHAAEQRKELDALVKAQPKVRKYKISFDKYMELLDTQMFLQQDLKELGKQLKQMWIDMEQEAEPEGGPKADQYGRDLMKLETEYKKVKAKLDKVDARVGKYKMY